MKKYLVMVIFAVMFVISGCNNNVNKSTEELVSKVETDDQEKEEDVSGSEDTDTNTVDEELQVEEIDASIEAYVDYLNNFGIKYEGITLVEEKTYEMLEANSEDNSEDNDLIVLEFANYCQQAALTLNDAGEIPAEYVRLGFYVASGEGEYYIDFNENILFVLMEEYLSDVAKEFVNITKEDKGFKIIQAESVMVSDVYKFYSYVIKLEEYVKTYPDEVFCNQAYKELAISMSNVLYHSEIFVTDSKNIYLAFIELYPESMFVPTFQALHNAYEDNGYNYLGLNRLYDVKQSAGYYDLFPEFN